MKSSNPITRRELLAASAATLAGSACARHVQGPPPGPVSITRAAAYDQSLYATVRQIFELHKLDVRGKRVVLKPNLVEFEPVSTINTSPLLVHAAFEAFLDMGAASVRIAEGPGHRRTTLDLADSAGYFSTVKNFEDSFTDLNLDEVTRVYPKQQFSRVTKLYLPNTVLGADLLVSMPKMKTHHWVGATLSMKNLFGTVPSGVYGWPKNMLHWAGINESIADLHAAYPRQFALVDGIVGMEGNGPIQGVPKAAGVLVAGRDPLSVDATCARIMCIDPDQMMYLGLAARARGTGFSKTQIRQLGEAIENVATPFALPPNMPEIRLKTA